MDEQQQAAANTQIDPTQPVVEQPAEAPVAEAPQETPSDQPQQPEAPVDNSNLTATENVVANSDQAVQDPITPPVDPKQDFISAYDALCQEKNLQFQYQLSFGVGDDGTFDLTKGILNRLVVDLSSE